MTGIPSIAYKLTHYERLQYSQRGRGWRMYCEISVGLTFSGLMPISQGLWSDCRRWGVWHHMNNRGGDGTMNEPV